MHQEDRDVVEFQFDDEPLDAGIEIMESLAAHPRRREEGVGLLADDGHHLIHRGDAVLALEGGVMAQASAR